MSGTEKTTQPWEQPSDVLFVALSATLLLGYGAHYTGRPARRLRKVSA